MAAVIYADAGERLAEHPRMIDDLTAEAVRAALVRHVPPDRLVLVAVGPADRLRPQLERFGPVEIVPADAAFEVIELPSMVTTPPTPEQVAKGRALVARSAAAHGGLERLRGIKDSSLEGDVIMAPGAREHTGRIVQVRKDPDRFLFSLTVSVLKSTQVMNGDQAWLQPGDASTDVEDLDSLSAVGLRTAYRSDLRRLLLTAADAGSRVSWRGRERRDDRDVDVIEVVSEAGVRQVLFLDGETRRLIAMEQHDAGHVVRRLYRDLREVSGVLWPFSEERLLDGQRTMIFAFNRVSFNTGVKDALFLRPGSGPATGTAPPVSRPRSR